MTLEIFRNTFTTGIALFFFATNSVRTPISLRGEKVGEKNFGTNGVRTLNILCFGEKNFHVVKKLVKKISVQMASGREKHPFAVKK
ncbi:MAG: hypothetical protein IJG33_13960 [Selenomonadaceae bacterium]|nr:hypothetical protein [Selenomonadaceae bacterium]